MGDETYCLIHGFCDVCGKYEGPESLSVSRIIYNRSTYIICSVKCYLKLFERLDGLDKVAGQS